MTDNFPEDQINKAKKSSRFGHCKRHQCNMFARVCLIRQKKKTWAFSPKTKWDYQYFTFSECKECGGKEFEIIDTPVFENREDVKFKSKIVLY